MAFNIFIIILFSSFITSCSDLDSNTRRDTNTDRRGSPRDLASSSACLEFTEEEQEEEGSSSVESIETVSFSNWLKNCKTGVSAPDNTVDMVMNAVGLKNKYPPGRFRECLRCKLADAHNRICSARDELERQRQDANSESDRIRVENSIARLDEIQFNFNETLHKQANKYNKQANKFEDKDSKTVLGRAFNWFGQEEAEALRDITNAESYNECNSSSYDDADEYRYEDNYNRNDSYARPRSY